MIRGRVENRVIVRVHARTGGRRHATAGDRPASADLLGIDGGHDRPRRSVDRSRKRSSRSPRDKRGNDRDRRRSRSGSAARKENKNGKRL